MIKNSIFVVCPYKDATQSGVIMSAFAFNKPVIATNVGGFPEQVIHNKYGLIIQPNDIEQLAAALQSLCSKISVLESFSENIQKGYESGEYSWKHIVSEHIAFYKTAIIS